MISIVNRWTGAVIVEGEFADIKSLLAANPKANLRDADLSGADLSDANLRGADLRRADLRRDDLRGADLSDADLRRADLRGADLDFASWPLWCGSTKAIVNERIKAQLLYHSLCLVGDSVEIPQAMKDFVNSNFHRIGELPKL